MSNQKDTRHRMLGLQRGPSYCTVCLGHWGIDLPYECPHRPMNLLEMENVRAMNLNLVAGTWSWAPDVLPGTVMQPVIN